LEQYLATKEASRAAQISLVAEVAVQYLTLSALDEQLSLLQETLKSVEAYYDLVNRSYQLGNSGPAAGGNPGRYDQGCHC
jgi:multidrug efflux system outer membrane protein